MKTVSVLNKNSIILSFNEIEMSDFKDNFLKTLASKIAFEIFGKLDSKKFWPKLVKYHRITALVEKQLSKLVVQKFNEILEKSIK